MIKKKTRKNEEPGDKVDDEREMRRTKLREGIKNEKKTRAKRRWRRVNGEECEAANRGHKEKDDNMVMEE